MPAKAAADQQAPDLTPPTKPDGWWRRHWRVAMAALELEKLLPVVESRHRDEREFLPAVLEVVESPASPAGRAVSLTICAAAGIAIAWSILGWTDIIAVAPGRVIPTSDVQIIQPREVANVRAIHVREGQIVSAGDALIELDTTSTVADTAKAEQELIKARLEQARLKALADDLAPQDYVGVPGASVEETELHRTYLAREREKHQATLASLDSENTKTSAGIRGVQAEIARLEKILPIAKERADGRKTLADKGAGPRMQYLDAAQALIEAEQQLEVQQHKLTELRAALESLKSQRTRARAEFTADAYGRLAQIELQVAALSQEAVKAQDRNRLMTLTAPVDGVVQQLQIHTVGGVVTPAQQLMVIVPANTGIEVEAMIQNRDIGFVRPDQPVEIKVESFPFTRYGIIRGTVRVVSKDAVADERVGLIYPARVILHDPIIHAAEGDIPLSPGMAVSAEVKTGERRIIEYLIAPITQYVSESLRER